MIIHETRIAIAEAFIVCDLCGQKESVESIEAGEYLRINTTGGFGSVFGDGNSVRLDLCERCLDVRLGDLIRKNQLEKN